MLKYEVIYVTIVYIDPGCQTYVDTANTRRMYTDCNNDFKAK